MQYQGQFRAKPAFRCAPGSSYPGVASFHWNQWLHDRWNPWPKRPESAAPTAAPPSAPSGSPASPSPASPSPASPSPNTLCPIHPRRPLPALASFRVRQVHPTASRRLPRHPLVNRLHSASQPKVPYLDISGVILGKAYRNRIHATRPHITSPATPGHPPIGERPGSPHSKQKTPSPSARQSTSPCVAAESTVP
jgi:hypothetical protein